MLASLVTGAFGGAVELTSANYKSMVGELAAVDAFIPCVCSCEHMKGVNQSIIQ